jgi:hypothetical protein
MWDIPYFKYSHYPIPGLGKSFRPWEKNDLTGSPLLLLLAKCIISKWLTSNIKTGFFSKTKKHAPGGTQLALSYSVFHRILDLKTGCISILALFFCPYLNTFEGPLYRRPPIAKPLERGSALFYYLSDYPETLIC